MKYALRLSRDAKDHIEDYKQAFARLAGAPIESQEAADAFVALKMREKELAEYIDGLERTQRIPQEIHVIEVIELSTPRFLPRIRRNPG